jgi:hypothetical protein
MSSRSSSPAELVMGAIIIVQALMLSTNAERDGTL